MCHFHHVARVPGHVTRVSGHVARVPGHMKRFLGHVSRGFYSNIQSRGITRTLTKNTYERVWSSVTTVQIVCTCNIKGNII